MNNAHKYADLALKSDKFNPACKEKEYFDVYYINLFSVKALTNKGNCCYAQEDYDKARYYYEEALNIDAGSVEALHNLSMFSYCSIF